MPCPYNRYSFMPTVAEICELLESLAPTRLAADWDNVGLLVGDRSQTVERVMTCLTITPAVADEATTQRVGMVVTHHPLPFKPIRRLTTDDPSGRILLQLIRAGVAVYSPHTAFDSAAGGINQHLAEGLGLTDIAPLEGESLQSPAEGTGRFGRFTSSQSLQQVAQRLKGLLSISGLHVVGSPDQPIQRVGIACGSGGDLLPLAIAAGCELFVTGEARLHTCYEAEARGVALLLPGHYASERFGVERLAAEIGRRLPAITAWPSGDERDPLVWM
jgi:dinuclear metal center YbgI/SA1388 family protein